MDIWSKEKRSQVMSKIKGKDTQPELILRSSLHKNGYRFRLHEKKLPGKPDLIFPKYKAVIFVHGCYWHHHKNCKEGRITASNTDFWQEKFSKNKARDKRNVAVLSKAGWKVLTVWECEIEKNIDRIIRKVKTILNS